MFHNVSARSIKCFCVYLAFIAALAQVMMSSCDIPVHIFTVFAVLGLSANQIVCAASSFILGGVCSSIIAASPVFCSFCSLAPTLISHIDIMRVIPNVISYLEGGHYSIIQAAFTRVLGFIGKVRVSFAVFLS